MIKVHCPHCGEIFAIDPKLETAVARRTAPDPDLIPGAVVYRPTCPQCGRKMTVRVPEQPNNSQVSCCP
jgi:hypothetical protein